MCSFGLGYGNSKLFTYDRVWFITFYGSKFNFCTLITVQNRSINLDKGEGGTLFYSRQ